MKSNSSFRTSRGYPYPFGTTAVDEGINFALASTEATAIFLCLFETNSKNPLVEIPLDPEVNKTGNVWHVLIHGLSTDMLYAYKVAHPPSLVKKFLSDPYAKSIKTGHQWANFSELPYLPLGVLPAEEKFDWENDSPPKIPKNDLIIYEMHIRGFTQHPSSGVSNPGSFLGVIEKIPYLLDLGINAVELLPIQEFDEMEYFLAHPNAEKPYCNFWGYSTVNFFAPMGRYATNSEVGVAAREFKEMVKALHSHGIEVILDIVFNHTAEGNADGPVLSYKGIDNSIYYLFNNQGKYSNYSGCGNTLNANHPRVVEMIIDCLRYWTTEMHVDGFRFDLASALTRGSQGAPLAQPPLIQSITSDPLLAHIKLIAEPWDASGLYQVGHFSPSSRWSEWNDKYRDSVRRFIRGAPGSKEEFATRLCGSEDLYSNRGPLSSLNFITAHDGFTLADLVSYNKKHNLSNNENNLDGSNDNQSWNCGKEGPTEDLAIIKLRERQMRNFHLALMLSQGIPMLHMGDEYGHTKDGNNNSWCHDTPLNWFLWDQLKDKAGFYRFYRFMIDFRLRHSLLRKESFLTSKDIEWHGSEPFRPVWNKNDLILSFTLKDLVLHNDLYVAFNAQNQVRAITIPQPSQNKKWHLIVNTAEDSPSDFCEESEAPVLSNLEHTLSHHSAILLKAL